MQIVEVFVELAEGSHLVSEVAALPKPADSIAPVLSALLCLVVLDLSGQVFIVVRKIASFTHGALSILNPLLACL